MANMLDYLDWRGDLTMKADPFNEVDNLILAELSYIAFDGIVGEEEKEGIPLRQAAHAYFLANPTEGAELGVLVPGHAIVTMLGRMARSARFSEMRLLSYVNHLDLDAQVQFAVLTVEVAPRVLYVSFRGTDDTLVGWKEDFNMSFMDTVPAQAEAREYLDRMASRYPRATLLVGGHSKGGNLAVYAAVWAKEKTQEQILAVYNNDGPGFREELLSVPEHIRMEERIRTIVPETDVVGMLMSHEERYSVVRSDQVGMMQHNGFTWQVLRDAFVHLSDISTEGHVVDRTLQGFANGMTPEQREKFSDALYEVLRASNANTLRDLQQGKWRTVSAILRRSRELDKESQEALNYTLALLFKEGAKNLREALAKGARLPRFDSEEPREKRSWFGLEELGEKLPRFGLDELGEKLPALGGTLNMVEEKLPRFRWKKDEK